MCLVIDCYDVFIRPRELEPHAQYRVESVGVVLGKNKHVHSFRGRPRNFSTRLVARWLRGGCAVVRRWFGGDSRGRSRGNDRVRVNPAKI